MEKINSENNKAQSKSSYSEDFLWLSPLTNVLPGKAIRGGIPICWPWFGKNEQSPSLPQHGFARTSLFSVTSIHQDDDLTVHIQLQLKDNQLTRQQWPYSFSLTVHISLSDTLTLSICTENKSAQSMPLTQAIHSYYLLDDIANAKIEGLNNSPYLDKTNAQKTTQLNPLTIVQETDRIYHKQNAILQLQTRQRTFHIVQNNDTGTIVWNPWQEKSKSMADFPDKGYLNMLCIEAANAPEPVMIKPNESYTLSQSISVSI